jgi:triphosphoribosyl-dephospho-CoA synthase
MPRPIDTTVTPTVLTALTGLACVPGSRGWSAAVAGILEATAEKQGNVHPRASFPDLAYDDLVAAAVAIAPVIDRAAMQPLGRTILDAVEASRAAADTNANLGIILLTAPLAAVPDGERLDAAAVGRVLARIDNADAALVWRAIDRARPGGMGSVSEHDLAGPPPDDLRQAMRAAAARDQIARLWTEGYERLFNGPVADLEAAVAAGLPLLAAIVDCHLRQLAREPDSLIARKHGQAAAEAVAARAATILNLPATDQTDALIAFDSFLRAPRRLNPGTTADLLAAALYILVRSGRIMPVFLPSAAPP